MVSGDFPPLAEFPTIVYNSMVHKISPTREMRGRGGGIFSFFSHFAITGLHGAVVLKGL